MRPELDIYGVYIPTLAALVIAAFVLSSALKRFLSRLGFYRYIWHPPLFNTAIYVIMLWIVFIIFRIF